MSDEENLFGSDHEDEAMMDNPDDMEVESDEFVKPKLEFCPDCHNLLYPSYNQNAIEDGISKTGSLQMICKNCSYAKDAKNNCVYLNQLETVKG